MRIEDQFQQRKCHQMPNAVTTQNKRAVNLTLSDSLVLQAKTYTHNLSATVEALLSEFVIAQRQAQAARRQQAHDCCAEWNTVHASVGSFADDHSTL